MAPFASLPRDRLPKERKGIMPPILAGLLPPLKLWVCVVSCCILGGCYSWKIVAPELSAAELQRMSAYLNKLGIPTKVVDDREVRLKGPNSCVWSLHWTLIGRLPGEDAWRELGRRDSEEEMERWLRRLVDAAIDYGVYEQTLLVRPVDFLRAREAVGEQEADGSYVLLFPEGSWRFRRWLARSRYHPEKEGPKLRRIAGEGVYVRAVDQLRVLGFDEGAGRTLWSNHFFKLELTGEGGLPIALSAEEAQGLVPLLKGAGVHAFRARDTVYYRPSCTEPWEYGSGDTMAENLVSSWVVLRRRSHTLE